MKRIIIYATAALILCTAVAALAADYRYVPQDTFKQWLESGRKMVLVDIQRPADFAKRHFKGALATGAYPVKSDEEKKLLDSVLGRINASQEEVVIVCPRGGGGARNTWDYLKAKGVAESRMYILEKGSEGWPYSEMCVTGKE
jgi:rhodanese-related sulfurtransferase